MPIRKIPRSHRSIRGIHPWRHAGRSIGFESTLERDFITTMVFDTSVEDIEEQPLKIDYIADDRRRTYTPDFLVTRAKDARAVARYEIVEVKHRNDLRKNWAEYRLKFRAAKNWAAGRNMKFRLVTDRTIRGPRLENLKWLLQFLSAAADREREEKIIKTLKQSGPRPIHGLLSAIAPCREEQAHYRSSVYRLLALGQLNANLRAPICQSTLISLRTVDK
jgi:hypothetical protein